MKHAIYIPILNSPLWNFRKIQPLSTSRGFPFSKTGPLSLFKNTLTYHFVVFYLVDQHYVAHNVISFQAPEGRGSLQGFSLKSNYKFQNIGYTLGKRQNELLVEAIQEFLKKCKKESKDETIRS